MNLLINSAVLLIFAAISSPRSALACSPPPAATIVIPPPPVVIYASNATSSGSSSFLRTTYRCQSSISGLVTCRNTTCEVGESQTPSSFVFSSLETCSNFTLFMICYNDTTGAMSCRQDIFGCPTGASTRTGDFTFSLSSDCLTYISKYSYIRCLQPNGQLTCRSPSCLSGETALSGTPVLSWSDLASCQAQLYWGAVCYKAIASATYYQIYASTIANVSCSYGDLLIGYVQSSTLSGATSQASSYYSPYLLLNHYRCLVNGAPVCRPNMGTGNKCAANESALTSTPVTVWNTLADCTAQLYWGIGCYQALNLTYTGNAALESTYFSYTAVYDTETGVSCPINSRQFSPLLYGTNPTALLAKLAPYYTDRTTLTHYRCNVNGLPVCRPKVDYGNDDGCGIGEKRLTLTYFSMQIQWETLAACDSQRFCGLICYSPIEVSEYYNLYAVTTLNPTCAGPHDVSVAYVCGPDTSTITTLTNDLTLYYNSYTSLTHQRCWKNAAIGPICRPVLPTTNGCALNETRLIKTDVISWNDLASCNDQRFWGVGCYVPYRTPANSDPFFSYVSYLDNPQGAYCPINSVQLAPLNFSSSATSLLSNKLAPFYTNSTQLTHYRCDLSTSAAVYPVCRPMIPTGSIDMCGQNETRITGTPTNQWQSWATCSAQRYWWIVCYNPNLSPIEDTALAISPFSFYIDANITSCPANMLQLGFYYAATNVAPTTPQLQAQFYNTTSLMTHYRCNAFGVPVCRPVMNTPTGCAFNETRLTDTTVTQWNTLSSCDAQRVWGRICYEPNTNAGTNYYTITEYTAIGAQCPSYALSIGFAGQPLTTSFTQTLANTFYTNSMQLTHYRCWVSSSVPVCRPNLGTASGCAESEDRLTTTSTISWSSMGACTAQIRWGVGCYVPNNNTDPYYTFVPYEDTPLGAKCPINSVQLAPLLYAPDISTLQTKIAPYYVNNTQLTHYRCNTGNNAVCRPNIPTGSIDNCAVNETRITSTTTNSWQSLAACMAQQYWGMFCYSALNATDATTGGYYTIYGNGGNNGIGSSCNNGDLALATVGVTKAAYTGGYFTTASNGYSYYQNYTILQHYRCYSPQIGTPICRPANSATANGCGWWEDRLTGTTSIQWDTYSDCLNQLHWGIGCYVAVTTASPYYNFMAVEDTSILGTNTCPTNSVKLAPLNAAATSTALLTLLQTYYTNSTMLTHQRCKVNNVPVCRPTSLGCGANEIALSSTLTTTYPNLGNCTSYLYSYLMCYNEQYPSNYTCTSDLNGCSGSIYRVIGSGSADTDANAITACWNMRTGNSVLWSRCQVLYPNNGNAAQCRPGANGAGCLGGEVLLQQNLPLASCMGNLYIAYYAPTQYYYNKVLNNGDYPSMTYWECLTQPFYNTLTWIALAADFAVYSDCTVYNPTYWFRCHTTSLVSYVTCRPYQNSITCNSNEYQNTSSLYTSPNACLKDSVATSYTFRTCTNTTDNNLLCTAAGSACVAGTVESNDGKYYFRSACN